LTAAGKELDAKVRALLSAGERDRAATMLLDALGPGVLGYLLAILPDEDGFDAFSLFEEDVWRGLEGFRWESSLRGWAYRLAGHAASRTARSAYRRRRRPLPSSFASRVAASGSAASGLGGRRDLLARIRETLPAEDRALLVLRVDRELEWDEVAEALAREGTPVAVPALRKRFERLVRRLRERVEALEQDGA